MHVHTHAYMHTLLPAENIRVLLQFLIRSNVNTNSWQCCTTHQELSISSTLKMCFMCLYGWIDVCVLLVNLLLCAIFAFCINAI